jgi:glycosyltransferase involved in cell wall biosynthesis
MFRKTHRSGRGRGFQLMQVLQVIPSVGPLRGGPSVMVQTMAQGLTRAGVEVHIATTDDNGRERLDIPLSVPVVEAGVTYWHFPRQTRFYTFSWPLSWWLARHVRDYNLVHIHALFSFAAIPAAFWCRRYGIPYIVRPLGTLNRWGVRNRHPWLKKLSLRFIEQRILSGAAVVHYTSEQERLEAAELGIVDRSAVIPNAIDITSIPFGSLVGRFRARYPQLADRFIMIFLSRLDAKKGLDLLLPAFARVRTRYPIASLVLAGSGDAAFVARLQREAARLGIDSDVLWTGFLSGEDKWAALADADLFVLPSYSENFGVAAVEAMACGLPVVVSDQVGIHQEIAAAQAGLVVRCDVEALTAACSQLLGDAPLRTVMGRNGQVLARTSFSLEAVTKRLVNLYAELTKLPAGALPQQVSSP